VEGGTAHLPVTDLSIRAEPLTPQQWREKLKARAIVGTTDSSRLKKVLLLDVRNGTSNSLLSSLPLGATAISYRLFSTLSLSNILFLTWLLRLLSFVSFHFLPLLTLQFFLEAESPK
jgi:hypothetical protein